MQDGNTGSRYPALDHADSRLNLAERCHPGRQGSLACQAGRYGDTQAVDLARRYLEKLLAKCRSRSMLSIESGRQNPILRVVQRLTSCSCMGVVPDASAWHVATPAACLLV